MNTMSEIYCTTQSCLGKQHFCFRVWSQRDRIDGIARYRCEQCGQAYLFKAQTGESLCDV